MSQGAWAEYDRWNEAVLDVLFPELEVPEPVYLDFEDDILAALSARTGVATANVEEALLDAVRGTLTDGGPATIFVRHMDRTRSWVRRNRQGTPPFLALLSAFCLAAERMAQGDGMSVSNYFGRLREVLGRDPGDTRIDGAYRRVAERLWGEHNRWLLQLDGLRGLPTAYALSYRFVGLTLSQALVRSGDRENLKSFFRQYGFAPGAEVAPSELQLVLESWINQNPSPVSSSLERLWKRGQAKERIAQAAAVALAAWDGSTRERGPRLPGQMSGGGQLSLSLEVGGFPRRRFAVQALLYLPEAGTPRDAQVLTSEPPTGIELAPDIAGALGLGRGSSLHARDVLEGVLKIQDSLSGQVLERRPRRLVLFREDDLSRRWIESPHVMLGDNVRLLVHEDLATRLEGVLERVARPGWSRAVPYPGQPDGWVLYDGVEIFNHPGSLVKSESIDDLSPLVPLTTSQLKVAGGFALPGQTRGKWHAWAPPEIRAISDNPTGFRVRIVDTHAFEDGMADGVTETVVAEWSDHGSGVVVESMADLELEDGDYRIEMVADGKTPLATSMVRLRSANTPDQRQWSQLESIEYSGGVGVLGLPTSDTKTLVKGHVVSGLPGRELQREAVPSAPSWSADRKSARTGSTVVRLTMPDPDSCLYTGRHREQIDLVPTDSKGRPLEAWTHGRCKGCGLVRRYPTKLRYSSYGRGRDHAQSAKPDPTQHDLSHVSRVAPPERDWATAFDALLHTGGGSWSQLERIAYQIEASALFLDQFARTLEVLGHLDVRRDQRTLEPVAWEVAPTALAGTEAGYLFSGYWPGVLYESVGGFLEDLKTPLSVHEVDDGVSSYFADAMPAQVKALAGHEHGRDVEVVDLAWRDLAEVLPPLSEVLEALPRESDSMTGEISWFHPKENTWVKSPSLDATGAYRVRRFKTLDVVRTSADVANGTVARSTVQLSKHLAALMAGGPLVAYDGKTRALDVPLGADLPGLYGRAAVAASGEAPRSVERERLVRYANVPAELAEHLYYLLSH